MSGVRLVGEVGEDNGGSRAPDRGERFHHDAFAIDPAPLRAAAIIMLYSPDTW